MGRRSSAIRDTSVAGMNDDVARVAAGYDAVYAAIPQSPTFRRIWREHAIGPGYPEEFEHISFLRLPN